MLIVAILLSLIFSGFFSGMEIAFVSCNRMQMEMELKKGGLAARPLTVFFNNPNTFVSTMLVGNNIVLIVYGILFAKLFDSTIFAGLAADNPALVVTLDTILSTFIVLFTGEFLPKMLFKAQATRLLPAFAIPAYICYVLLYPITLFIISLSNILMKIFGVKMDKGKKDEFSKVDLDYLVQESIENAEDSDEGNTRTLNFFQNALEFSETDVRDCMVPRTEICAIQSIAPLSELLQKFIESGRSKIIVYQEDIDHIIGYIHTSEIFRLYSNGNNEDWNKSIHTMPFVPENMPAKKLMQIFLAKKKTLGVVVDEYGGTSGIVTLEDICEEIFGEIEDEHDKTTLLAKRLADNEYIFSARQEIDHINEMFDLSLPEGDDYLTLAGLILDRHQGFPKVNEEITVGIYRFKIIKRTAAKIELVKLYVDDGSTKHDE